MITDYMYMNDIIYTINEDVKLMFKTIASTSSSGKVYSNCKEFKLNSDMECNTMIKRSISYYLFIEDRRSGKVEKLYIYPETMLTLLSTFEYARMTWFENGINGIYGYMDNGLNILTDDYRLIQLPFDKVIKLSPGVLKHDLGDMPCLDMYLNTQDPIQIKIDTFNGLYYILSRFDMLCYANTALSFMMLRNEPVNRIDYSSDNTANKQNLSDQSNAIGTTGRSLNGSSISKKSLLD